MTEQEFNNIKSLIIGLAGITEFKSTIERCDNALNILDRDKQLLIHSVVVPKGTLCDNCGEVLTEGVNIDYCTNNWCGK